jgi:hypothetical protein
MFKNVRESKRWNKNMKSLGRKDRKDEGLEEE